MLQRVVVVLLALALWVVNPGAAQERYGGLTGTVLDAAGLPVPGATINAKNNQTNKTYQAVTNGEGTYLIPDLDPGRYTVVAESEKDGRVRVPIRIAAGHATVVDLQRHRR